MRNQKIYQILYINYMMNRNGKCSKMQNTWWEPVKRQNQNRPKVRGNIKFGINRVAQTRAKYCKE